MKKSKKIFVTLIFMLTFSFFINQAVAANTDDSPWSFSFSRTNFNLYTPARDKTNATPVYMYVESLKGDPLKVRAVTGNYIISSYTSLVHVNKVGKYCISSNIYEDGYNSARIWAQKYNTFSTSHSWVQWSPDSWSCK